MKDEVKAMVKARNAALLSLDYDRICGYLRKYGGEPRPNDLVFWAGVHKARVAITSSDWPEQVREVSRQWLIEHGFRPEM